MSNELVFSLSERLLVVCSIAFVPLLVPRLDWHDVPRGRRPRKCADHKRLPPHRVVRHVLRTGWRPSGLPKCCETCRFGKAFERKGERDFYFQSLKVRKVSSVGVLETLLSLKICSRMCPRMDSQLPVLSQRRRPGPKRKL